MLALDPARCEATWGRSMSCIEWGTSHLCERDQRDSGPHRCICGKTGKQAPKKKTPAKLRAAKRRNDKKEADKLAGDKVRARGYCQASGKDRYNCGGILQWAHIETRRNLRLRWEEWGALCLCAGHHRLYTNRPTEWTDFLDDNFPDEIALVRAHRLEHFDGDYESVIARLKDSAQKGSQ